MNSPDNKREQQKSTLEKTFRRQKSSRSRVVIAIIVTFFSFLRVLLFGSVWFNLLLRRRKGKKRLLVVIRREKKRFCRPTDISHTVQQDRKLPILNKKTLFFHHMYIVRYNRYKIYWYSFVIFVFYVWNPYQLRTFENVWLEGEKESSRRIDRFPIFLSCPEKWGKRSRKKRERSHQTKEETIDPWLVGWSPLISVGTDIPHFPALQKSFLGFFVFGMQLPPLPPSLP